MVVDQHVATGVPLSTVALLADKASRLVQAVAAPSLVQLVMRVALAVKAAMGTIGKRSRRIPSWRYSGRNSCPHSEMQWASSMAKKATGTCFSHVNIFS